MRTKRIKPNETKIKLISSQSLGGMAQAQAQAHNTPFKQSSVYLLITAFFKERSSIFAELISLEEKVRQFICAKLGCLLMSIFSGLGESRG